MRPDELDRDICSALRTNAVSGMNALLVANNVEGVSVIEMRTWKDIKGFPPQALATIGICMMGTDYVEPRALGCYETYNPESQPAVGHFSVVIRTIPGEDHIGPLRAAEALKRIVRDLRGVQLGAGTSQKVWVDAVQDAFLEIPLLEGETPAHDGESAIIVTFDTSVFFM